MSASLKKRVRKEVIDSDGTVPIEHMVAQCEVQVLDVNENLGCVLLLPYVCRDQKLVSSVLQ